MRGVSPHMSRSTYPLTLIAVAVMMALASCQLPRATTYALSPNATRAEGLALFDKALARIGSQTGNPVWSRDGKIWLCFEYYLPDQITLNAQFHKPTARVLYTIAQVSDSARYGRYRDSGRKFLQDSIALFTEVYGEEPKQTGSFDEIRAIFGEDLHRRCE